MPTTSKTSFSLKVSLSSIDNAACAFRDSLPDPSVFKTLMLVTRKPVNIKD